jgi:phosphate acetyltransferase
MPQSIYVAGAEFGTGKSAVVLGTMEILSGYTRKVGFFRPIVNSDGGEDSLIHLIATRYNLSYSYESMCGCDDETAHRLVSQGRYEELIKRVLGKFKALESECDVVLCAGTDYVTRAAAFEFDLNVDLANNLGCAMVPVVNGHDRPTQDLVDFVGLLLDSLRARGCDVLTMIVNRVAPEHTNNVAKQLEQSVSDGTLIYVLPEQPLLARPTVGEVARALDAETVIGEAESFAREVSDYQIAAMTIPHFLEFIHDGTLLITPADRSDIILGSLLAHRSTSYPQISGILLTGGFAMEPQVKRLIEGLQRLPVPVISVGTSTFETATQIHGIEGAIAPESERKIAAVLGSVEANVDVSRVKDRFSVKRSSRVTPLMFEYELLQRAKSERQHIVLPEGSDERILRASEILLLRDVVDLTLLGNPDTIKEKIDRLGIQLGGINIIDPAASELREKYAQSYFELRKHKGITLEAAYDVMSDVSYFGTMMVHRGDASGMVSGAVNTTQHTIRPALEFVRTRPGFSIVSSVFFMCLEDRVLVYGDCAINPNPNAEQLADIAISSADTARMFGVEPLVAMLSYSTGESGKGEDVEKVREAVRLARERSPDLSLEGPIQYDAAVDDSVGRSKLPGSEVAGHATVFIFPDLNTGNNTYKAVQRSAGAVAVGPVLQGLNKPVNDLSRGCLVADIVNTVAITAIQAQQSGESSG